MTWIHESCEAMYRDPQSGTAPLAEFLEEYDNDDNVWWMIGSGHHLNLFEDAVERYEEMKKLADDLAAVLDSLDLGHSDVEVERVLKRWREARR